MGAGLNELVALTEGQGLGLRLAMRDLWTDHVVWTRGYIVSALDESADKISFLAEPLRTQAGVHVPSGVFKTAGPWLGDAEAVAGRLLRNQDDIGDAIAPYYGKKAGHKLTKLLKEHIMIAVSLVKAVKKDDKKDFRKFDKEWDQNARDIAKFLAGANPNWSRVQLTDLLFLHLNLTKQETAAVKNQDWETSRRRFDDIFNEIMTLADTLSVGIIKQFPEQFED